MSDPPVAERSKHPYLTHDMMLSIPEAVSSTVSRNGEMLSRVGRDLSSRKTLFFTGCGTAFYASMLGQEFGRPPPGSGAQSYAVQALELQNGEWGLSLSSAVVGVSHSGITKTTVDALSKAKRLGARTVGITHFADRPIASSSDDLFVVGDGPDASRMHTKCYLDCGVAASLLSVEHSLASSAAGGEGYASRKEALATLPRLLSRVVAGSEARAREVAAKNSSKTKFYFAGTGPNVTTALEAALKIKETSYLAAEGMETEQLMHGPWVSLDDGTHLTLISPGETAHGRAVDLARAAKALDVPTLCIVKEGEKELSSTCDDSIELPEAPLFLTPFLSIIPLYFFAYYSSVHRGHNPDLLRYQDPRYWGARRVIFPPGTH